MDLTNQSPSGGTLECHKYWKKMLKIEPSSTGCKTASASRKMRRGKPLFSLKVHFPRKVKIIKLAKSFNRIFWGESSNSCCACQSTRANEEHLISSLKIDFFEEKKMFQNLVAWRRVSSYEKCPTSSHRPENNKKKTAEEEVH
jgi:hypothetical protein